MTLLTLFCVPSRSFDKLFGSKKSLSTNEYLIPPHLMPKHQEWWDVDIFDPSRPAFVTRDQAEVLNVVGHLS